MHSSWLTVSSSSDLIFYLLTIGTLMVLVMGVDAELWIYSTSNSTSTSCTSCLLGIEIFLLVFCTPCNRFLMISTL